MLADGSGATVEAGIVMPNCLRASPADSMRYRGLGQLGGTVRLGSGAWGAAMGATGLLATDTTAPGVLLVSPTPAALGALPVLGPVDGATLSLTRQGLPP